MGFGYLLIGYLVAFVLKLTASALQIGFLALFVGYGTMLLGIWKLKNYCRSFSLAGWGLYPLLVIAVYRTLESLSDTFLWNLPFLGGTLGTVIDWAEFLLLMLFHALLLSAIRELGMRLELKKISAAAVRNSIIVLLYGVVYVVYWLPISGLDPIRKYLGLSLNLLNWCWIICNLFLFVSCAKNICPAGEEDPQPKRYKWNFLNRIGDSFERTFHKASERNREDVEQYLRKKQDKRMKKAEEQDRINKERKKRH